MSGDPTIVRLSIALAGSKRAIQMEERRDGLLTPEATAHLELVHAIEHMLSEVVQHVEQARP